MFKAKEVIAFLVLEAILLQPVVLSKAAWQPYTGVIETNGSGTLYASNVVIGGLDFAGTTPSTIPSGQALIAVLSCTGAHGGTYHTSSGKTDIYQAPVFCYTNGALHFIPQIWEGGARKWYVDVPMNTYTDYWLFAKMKWISSPNNVTFYCYEYKTQTDFNQDTPNIWHKSHAAWTSSDTNFVVGTETWNSVYLQYLQLGTEATTNSTSITWQIHTDWLGYYYSSAWNCLPSYAEPGSSCYSAYYNSLADKVGGCDMYMKIGTHVFDDVQNYNYASKFSTALSPCWTNTGTFTPPVVTPFS